MGVDGSHFVLEALKISNQLNARNLAQIITHLGDASDHVVNHGTDSAEASDMLARAGPDGEEDFGRLALHNSDVHVNMSHILCEGSPGTSDSD